MQSDGNFVLYGRESCSCRREDDTVFWSSGAMGSYALILLRRNGNVAIFGPSSFSIRNTQLHTIMVQMVQRQSMMNGARLQNVIKRVAMEPGISCWHCFHCKGGSYNLCPDMKFFATPPIHGSLADQVVHPADLCFKLPENMSLEEGAMCEPLSVGVHACRCANVSAETTVLILGAAGPIGLVTMLTARSFGAPKIVLVDVDSHRLSVAKKLGPDAVVQVSTNTEDVNNEVAQIQEAMGVGIDVTFDCVGFSKTMTTALTATTSGGKVCLVGMGHNEMKVPLTPAAAREVDIVGIFRYKNTWPLCIDLINPGKIDVKPLITHRFGFSQDEVEKAFETSAKGSDAIKVMLNL
ncbi:L-threonine 3-dehydrogenase [Thalictrum thalictroides]|uniref:L-threonine 3-dehydrogenase n=1 Tax=Thalictrum thalictroides TaxID=46969 RepID=A0A7J6WCI7_THATH|nr:L-threonine 3-dehydrogenase [Thalictrum thalictroides]